MFIDIHVHAFQRLQYSYTGKQELCTPEQLIEIYDDIGVEKAVLLPIVSPESLMEIQCSLDILDIAEKYPDRFIPFCNVDPRTCHNTPDAGTNTSTSSVSR